VRRLITIEVYSDEKQLPDVHLNVRIWLHLKSHQWWSPPVVVGGPCGALRAGIGMTINLPGYLMSVTQHYLVMNDAHIIRFIYSFASFSSDWMWWLCL